MPSTVVSLRDTSVNKIGKATVPWGLPSRINKGLVSFRLWRKKQSGVRCAVVGRLVWKGNIWAETKMKWEVMWCHRQDSIPGLLSWRSPSVRSVILTGNPYLCTRNISENDKAPKYSKHWIKFVQKMPHCHTGSRKKGHQNLYWGPGTTRQKAKVSVAA